MVGSCALSGWECLPGFGALLTFRFGSILLYSAIGIDRLLCFKKLRVWRMILSSLFQDIPSYWFAILSLKEIFIDYCQSSLVK